MRERFVLGMPPQPPPQPGNLETLATGFSALTLAPLRASAPRIRLAPGRPRDLANCNRARASSSRCGAACSVDGRCLHARAAQRRHGPDTGQGHEARDRGAQDASCDGLSLPAASPRSARHAGHRAARPPQGDLRAWVLLARASGMPLRRAPGDAPRILGGEDSGAIRSATGSRLPGCAASAGRSPPSGNAACAGPSTSPRGFIGS